MRHFCAKNGPRCPAPLYRPLPPGIGAEPFLTGGRGGEGGGISCAQLLWDPPPPYILLQVHWESPVRRGRLFSGGSMQPQEGAAEVGVADKVVGYRGSRCPKFRNVIRGSCTGSLIIWVVYVGDVPTHWEYFGQLPPQVGPHTNGSETAEGTIW